MIVFRKLKAATRPRPKPRSRPRPDPMEEFENFSLGRIQEFHVCYVKKFRPPDNMR